MIATKPDLVLRFTRATLKGWTYAVENPTASGAMAAKQNPMSVTDLEAARVAASVPLVNTGEDVVESSRKLNPVQEEEIVEQGVLTAPLDVTQAYTVRFLEEIYAP